MKETMQQKLRKLENKVVELEDENASLWGLLEELDNSNVGNPIYREHFDAAFKKSTLPIAHEHFQD